MFVCRSAESVVQCQLGVLKKQTMVRGCIFPNCGNKMTRNTPQSFHRLPVGNRSVLKKWLGVLQMDTDASVHALRHADYRVCSDHFEREDYCQPHRRRHPIPKHFFLKKYAVPRVKELTDRLETSSGNLAVGGAAAVKATSSSVVSGNGNWDGAGGMDQITVVRIDDTHIAEEQSHDVGKGKDEFAEYYDMEYSVPGEDEVEEEEDSVFVIEYSNPEEEGESYQFTMSVDRPLPAKKPADRHPVVNDGARPPLPVMSKLSRPQRPRQQLPQKRKLISEEEVKKEEVISNKSVLELGENYSDVMEMNSGAGKGLMCTLCPPPGRLFKRGSGLAVHLKQMHLMVEKKTFFCTSCHQRVRSQIELDAHTKRHANQEAVFTCHLCQAETENGTEAEKGAYKGSKMGLKAHLEKEHPGVIPRCDICNKGFRSLASYLADQFRHVGKSPYFCGKCQIYEMTERGLSVHMKNHNKKEKQQEASAGNHLPTPEVPTAADNSATDDSDF